MNAHVLKFPYRLWAVFLYSIGNCNDSNHLAVHTEKQRCLPLFCQLFGLGFHLRRYRRMAADEVEIAAAQQDIVHDSG